MDPLQVNTDVLPPPLRALAMGVLVETPVSLHARSQPKGPGRPDQDEGGTVPRAELRQVLRELCGEVSDLVFQADDSREAAADVLGHLEYVLALVHGPAITSLLLQGGCRPRP
jgi:hypothetical protein